MGDWGGVGRRGGGFPRRHAGRLGYQPLTRESERALFPAYRGGLNAGPDRAAEIEPNTQARGELASQQQESCLESENFRNRQEQYCGVGGLGGKLPSAVGEVANVQKRTSGVEKRRAEGH